MTGIIRRSLLAVGLLCLTIARFAPGQPPRVDHAFFGMWSLDVAQSDFAGRPKLKSGQVNWGEHGWAFALVFPDDTLFTDAVMTDHGCTYVGVSKLTCEYEIVAPRHVRLTMKEDKRVTRVGDIELVSDDVTQTTHRVTPEDAAPYVEKTVWTREK
jgi:hypothetical protein